VQQFDFLCLPFCFFWFSFFSGLFPLSLAPAFFFIACTMASLSGYDAFLELAKCVPLIDMCSLRRRLIAGRICIHQ